MRVVAAMSGGVDSSVAAALMVEAGHEVIGVTLKLLPSGQWETESGCCSAEAAHDARRVAAALGIQHYVLDAAEEFEKNVVAPFADAYAAGETPNPCVWCNRDVKFGWFVGRARKMGAGALVTGHYARRRVEEDGSVRLLRAADRNKDQSYFLYRVPPADLAFARFPLDEMEKPAVREKAKALGFLNWSKPDSQEVCFVKEDTGHAPVVAGRHPEAMRAGEFVTSTGDVLGRHEGFAAYTVGQRRGLGIATGERMYVLDVLPAENRVVIGREPELLRSAAEVRECVWWGGAPESPFRAAVRIRSTHTPVPSAITPQTGDRAVVSFDEPQKGIAPGQSAVFFDGDLVLGGGILTRPST